MAAEPDCVFCGIVERRIPTDVVWESDQALAFRDVNPQAPTHVLVVPKTHASDVADLASAHPAAVASLVEAAAAVAEQEGIGDGYRLVFNTGAGAGQTVFHCHGHVLGGRTLSWPPG
ncbi:MAG TPA: HIT domain-containing protein [Nocardioidaceae bacterium]|jgi:histidine triad (HIT) family protein|nr:HIT domain-containing protein [Nocardioidaceae bacterium]